MEDRGTAIGEDGSSAAHGVCLSPAGLVLVSWCRWKGQAIVGHCSSGGLVFLSRSSTAANGVPPVDNNTPHQQYSVSPDKSNVSDV